MPLGRQWLGIDWAPRGRVPPPLQCIAALALLSQTHHGTLSQIDSHSRRSFQSRNSQDLTTCSPTSNPAADGFLSQEYMPLVEPEKHVVTLHDACAKGPAAPHSSLASRGVWMSFGCRRARVGGNVGGVSVESRVPAGGRRLPVQCVSVVWRLSVGCRRVCVGRVSALSCACRGFVVKSQVQWRR